MEPARIIPTPSTLAPDNDFAVFKRHPVSRPTVRKSDGVLDFTFF